MSEEVYEVALYGGGPWGFRLKGGKDFGRTLAIQSVTGGSKADGKGICAGDYLMAINGENTDKMTHLEAQNAIKRSQSLNLSLKRKAGNLATSMGTKSPVVTVDTTHSVKVDYKYNAKPKPFVGSTKTTPPAKTSVDAAPKSPVAKPPPEEKKEDNLEDSEVLKMLLSADISDDSTGLRRMSGGKKPSRSESIDDDELPPPPPEAFDEDEEDVGPQSRTFRRLEKSIQSGEEHPSALSRPAANVPTTTRVLHAPKPYSPPSHGRSPQTITVKTGLPPAPGHLPAPGHPSALGHPSAPGHHPATGNRPSGGADVNHPAPQPEPQPSIPQPKTTAPPNKGPRTPCCDSCGKVIQGPFVSALGRNWHPEHFCCNGCQRSLQNIGFVEEAGKMFCENCYNEKYAPKCASCNQAIVGVSVKALGKVYHQEHFMCAHCNKQLAGEGFHVENGLPYCSKDYKDLFSVKCYSCQQIIRAGDRWMEAVNQKWHADCFRCMTCGIVLEKTGFYTTGNRVFCPEHS